MDHHVAKPRQGPTIPQKSGRTRRNQLDRLIWCRMLALVLAVSSRTCNFNNSDPKRDGRCAVFAGLEPTAVVDPAYDKMLCFWPDPLKPDPNTWSSVQVGRAHPVNPLNWTRISDTSHMPASVGSRLSQPPFLTCNGDHCCFDGGFGPAEVLPEEPASDARWGSFVPIHYLRSDGRAPLRTSTTFNVTQVERSQPVPVLGSTTGGWVFCGIGPNGTGEYLQVTGAAVRYISGFSGDEEVVSFALVHDGTSAEIAIKYSTRAD